MLGLHASGMQTFYAVSDNDLRIASHNTRQITITIELLDDKFFPNSEQVFRFFDLCTIRSRDHF